MLFELGWVLPVLMLQWVLGYRLLWRARIVVLLAIVLPTTYLSLADGIAIANGIWTLHANRIVGIRIGDVPIEEIIFFAVTNTMVAQSVVLVTFWRRNAVKNIITGQPALEPSTGASEGGSHSRAGGEYGRDRHVPTDAGSLDT